MMEILRIYSFSEMILKPSFPTTINISRFVCAGLDLETMKAMTLVEK